MRGLVLSGAFAALVLVGCGKDGGSGAVVEAGKGNQGTPTKSRRPTDVGVKEATVADLDDVRADNATLVVVYEFWSVDDPASRDWLAKSVPFDLQWGGYGLATVFVCVDGPAKKAEALKVLEGEKAATRNYVLADPAKDKAALAEKYGYTGTTPYQVVFDRAGKRVWKTGDPLTVKAGQAAETGKGLLDPQGAARKDGGDTPRSRYDTMLQNEVDKK